MNTFSTAELKVLIKQPPQLCVSIFMPTDPVASRQDPIRLKNLLRLARERALAERDAGASFAKGLRSTQVKKLLSPVMILLTDELFWQHQQEGLAIFCTANLLRAYRLPLRFEELVVVADHFYLKPLLPLLPGNQRFYILALSHHGVKLLQVTPDSVSEIKLDVPKDLATALRFEPPERQLQSHLGTPGSDAGRAGPAGGATIFHGHGAGEEDDKENLSLYFHQVNAAVQARLQNHPAPLVLAGVEYLLSIYRQVNTYPHLLDEVIPENPEALKPQALHEQAWKILQPYFLQAQQEAIHHYSQLVATARASHNINEIIPAAYQGRIEQLFVALGLEQWGTFDPNTNRVERHSLPEPDDKALLDFAAVQTLLNGGRVYAVEPEQMPDNLPLAAIFRY